MFRRLHHQRVAEVLSILDAPLLAEHNCWFGGDTAIVLADSADAVRRTDPDYRALAVLPLMAIVTAPGKRA